jgi:signal transduction histidine kinase
MPVDVEIDLANRNLPREIEATLFRVLQEATNNVLRHAGATRLAVILESRKAEVRLLVEDDGKGFVPPENGQEAIPSGHLGLIGMRERLALVHGSLEVESAPDAGTTLYVRIPVAEEAAPS